MCNVENLCGTVTDYGKVQVCPLFTPDDGYSPEVDDDGGDQDGEVCHGVFGRARLID